MRLFLAICLSLFLCGCFGTKEKPRPEPLPSLPSQEELPKLGAPQVHPSDFEDPSIK